jgi:hypothetical protein
MRERLEKILRGAGIISKAAIERWLAGLGFLPFQNAEFMLNFLASATKEEITQISAIFEQKLLAYGNGDLQLLEQILDKQKDFILN